MSEIISVLDNGYIVKIEAWGRDESIIEAARMSTGKGFNGWGGVCSTCGTEGEARCPTCKGELPVGDEKLLAYLYNNKHMTPFEMAGMIIEVKAPIFVFREWHRHRTQSYNEMSARYIPLPDENYCPTVERIVTGAASTKNKQATGVVQLDEQRIEEWLDALRHSYNVAQDTYQLALDIGIPKELARLSVPVARYSRMRASANLRNWLAFLTLRNHPAAQWEIRVYAEQVALLIQQQFPHTYALYVEGEDHECN